MEAIKKPKKHQKNAFVLHTEDCHMGEEAEVKFKTDVEKCHFRAMDRPI